jgi:LysM repeat protein
MPTWKAMKAFATHVCLFCLAAATCATARAQTPTPGSETMQLELLTKKIDEQNAKIDALSQHLLKIELQLSKPGVMIGESSPAPSAPPTPTIDPARANASSHTVARGETLTSIAKMHKVGVEELQKFNHIENDRKLQIGQVIQIPASGAAVSPSPSPTPSPGTSGD